MLAQIGINRFSFSYTNANAASATPGTSVVPGASNVEGSWTQVASGANIAQDIYLVSILVGGGAVAATQKNHLLDIGVDPAGGSSYTAIISDIVCGESEGFSGGNTGGLAFHFPISIKAGSTVAVRIQGSNATAGTVRVVATFYGQPSHPELFRVGQYAETVGTITNSLGVSLTPGNTGAEGTWVSLGTTARACWWWQLGVQCDNTVMNNFAYTFDLAVGDGTNMLMIIENLRIATSTAESISAFPNILITCFAQVPAGATIYVRGSCQGTTDTGWNATAIGVGG